MSTWVEKNRAPGLQWSHERVRELYRVMRGPGARFELSPLEQEFLGPIDPDVMLKELDRTETTHKRRLLIGERLDVLGEPPSRWAVGVGRDGTPEIDWCPVPGGSATISILSDPTNANSPVADSRRRSVEPCHIARYPVTVAQYRAFIEAEDGWRDPAWWGEDLYRDAEGEHL